MAIERTQAGYQTRYVLRHGGTDDHRRILEQMIIDTLDEDPAVPVSTVVPEGHPAVELLHAAKTADLLVIGSRRHDAFTGMLLGSVSQHCLSHPPCPVVVVRHNADLT